MNKENILKDWIDCFFAIFSKDKEGFLKKSKDSFSNPIGTISTLALKNIFEELFGGFNKKKVEKELDAILRIMAIQEIKPSSSLSFVLQLKKILDKHNQLSSDINNKIDEMILMSIDIYVACREQIFKFKADHVKNRTLNILERQGVLKEVPEFGSEIISKEVFKSEAFQAELNK